MRLKSWIILIWNNVLLVIIILHKTLGFYRSQWNFYWSKDIISRNPNNDIKYKNNPPFQKKKTQGRRNNKVSTETYNLEEKRTIHKTDMEDSDIFT